MPTKREWLRFLESPTLSALSGIRRLDIFLPMPIQSWRSSKSSTNTLPKSKH